MGNSKKIFEGLLVLQFRTGNKEAFTFLVKRYNTKMCKHAFWYTYDMEIAKDIVQDSWRTILKKLPSLKNPNSFGSWAMRIVTRKSIDYLKRNHRDLEKLKEYYRTPRLNTDSDNKESDLLLVYDAIKKLPVNQQAVLRLFYLEEYSLREISEIINISEGTVKSRLYHAREKLKTIVNNRNYE